MTRRNGSETALPSVGQVASRFGRVRDRLDAYLLEDPAFSAQLAIYHEGELVVDLVGGTGMSADSIAVVASATKGVAGITLATLVSQGRLDLDARVVDYWPEFAPYGKHKLLVRELLSHQAGLLNVHGLMSEEDFGDSRRVAAALAASRPVWRPASAFGYHALTIGVLMEELSRRVAGTDLRTLYEERIRAPRDIQFWLGVPEAEDHRCVDIPPAILSAKEAADHAALPLRSDDLVAYAFNRSRPDPSPLRAGGSVLDVSSRRIRSMGFAAALGIGSALGLAQVYAAALGHLGDPLIDDETIDAMSQEQVWGPDRLSGVVRAFGVVFMKPDPRLPFGSFRAFGHDGSGGKLAFADPMYDMAFGYIPSPRQEGRPNVGADYRSIQLSILARECIAGS